MNKIKNSSFFRVISLILILTFISLDISYAYPPEHNAGNSTLATPSPLQQNPINASAEEFRNSILSDGSILGPVLSIGNFLFGDGIHMNRLESILTIELGDTAKYIDLSRVKALVVRDNELSALDPKDDIPPSAIIRIPYSKDGEKEDGKIFLALKDNLSVDKLAGYQWIISDKYAVKVCPSGYVPSKPAHVAAVRNTNIEISKPIAEVVVPVNKAGATDTVSATSEGSIISVRAIVKHVFAIVIMFASLFTMPAIGRSAGLAPEPAAISRADAATHKKVLDLAIKLDDENEDVRLKAVITLREISSTAREAVFALIKALDNRDLRVRMEVVYALGKIGPVTPEVVPALAKALDDENENASVRIAIVYALGEIGPAAKEAVPALIRAAYDKDWLLFERVARTIGKIGPAAKEAAPTLIKALDNSSVGIRLEAMEALGNIGPAAKEAVPALAKALDDDSAVIRLMAVKTLGKIGPAAKEALSGLWLLSKVDTDPEIRSKAEEAIRKIENVPGAPASSPGKLYSVNLPAAIFGAAALGSMFSAAKEFVYAHQATMAFALNTGLALAAILAIGYMVYYCLFKIDGNTEKAYSNARGATKYMAVVITVLASLFTMPAIGRSAGLAPEPAGINKTDAATRKEIPDLIKRLDNEDEYVRQGAVEALGNRGSAAKEAVPALIRASNDKSGRIRWRVAEALGKIDSVTPEVVPILIGMLGDEDYYVRWEAVYALGEIGPAAKEALPRLRLLLTDTDYNVRVNARIATRKIEGASETPASDLGKLYSVNLPAAIFGAATLGSIFSAVEDFIFESSVSTNILVALGLYTITFLIIWYRIFVRHIFPIRHDNRNTRDSSRQAIEDIGISAARPDILAIPHLIDLLKNGDRDARADAAAALGRIRPVTSKTISALIEALGDEDSGVRRNVIDAFGKIGPVSPKVGSALIETLDSDIQVCYAAEALGKIGPPAEDALPKLRQLLTDERVVVRFWAKEAIMKIEGVLKTPVSGSGKLYFVNLPAAIFGVAALGSAFSAVKDFIFANPVPVVIATGVALIATVFFAAFYMANWSARQPNDSRDTRDSSRQAIGDTGTPAARPDILAVPHLIDLLEKGDSDARANAATALGRIRPVKPEVIQALKKALEDEDRGVRGSAVDAFGEIGSIAPEDIPAMIKMLSDPDSHVQRRVAIAFRKIPVTPEVIRALITSMLRDNNYEAAATLGQFGAVTPEFLPTILPALIKALIEGDEYVRRASALALGGIGAVNRVFLSTILLALMNALGDSDSYVRGDVIDALGQIGPVTPEVIPAIAKMLKDDDGYVRKCAAETLRKLGALVRELEIERYMLDLSDPSISVRIEATKKLEEFDAMEPELIVRRYIIDLGNENNNEVRRRAAAFLIDMQDSSLDPMNEYLKCVKKYDHNYYVPLSGSDVEFIIGCLDRGESLNLVCKPFIRNREYSGLSHGGHDETGVVYSRAQLIISKDAARRKLPLPEIPDFGRAQEIPPPYAPDVPFWELEVPSRGASRKGMELRSVASIREILDGRSWLWDNASTQGRDEAMGRINLIRPKVTAIVGTLYENNIISSKAPLVSMYLAGSFPWTDSPNDVNIVVVVKGHREFGRIHGSVLPIESREIAPDTGVSFEVVGLETLKRAARGENFDGAKVLRRKLTAYSGAVPLAGIDIFDKSTPLPESYRVMRDDLIAGADAALKLQDETKYDIEGLKAKIAARREEAVALVAWIYKKSDNGDDKADSTKLLSAPLFSALLAAAWLPSVFSAIADFTAAHPIPVVAIEIGIIFVLFYAILRMALSAQGSISADESTSGRLTRSQSIESITASITEDLKGRKEVSPQVLFGIVQSWVPKSMTRLRMALEELKPLSEVEGVSADVISQEISLATSMYRLSKEESWILWLALTGPGQGQGTGNETESGEHSKPEEEAKAPEASVAPLLLDIAESSLNNNRAEFMATGNSIINLYAVKADTDELTGDVAGVVNLNRKMATAEIVERVKRAIAGIEKSSEDNMSPSTRTAIEALRNGMNQFEADGGVASLMVLARKAKIENQKLIIGLETDWIPAVNVKGSLQRSAISALVREIDAIGDALKSMGLDNVEIVRGRGTVLAGDLRSMANKTHTSLRNIVVMASINTINSNSFAWFTDENINKDIREDNRPFLASIDPTKLIELYAEFGISTHSSNQLHIRLMTLLYTTLELAAGKRPSQAKITWIVFYDEKMRRVIFLPDADIKDYEVLRNTYALEAKALAAA